MIEFMSSSLHDFSLNHLEHKNDPLYHVQDKAKIENLVQKEIIKILMKPLLEECFTVENSSGVLGEFIKENFTEFFVNKTFLRYEQ
ncbi:MAG: hypothetical protein ISN64_01735 [Rickettsia sp.]|nr:hypothetical protein [Rickettsia sp.]